VQEIRLVHLVALQDQDFLLNQHVKIHYTATDQLQTRLNVQTKVLVLLVEIPQDLQEVVKL
jgi:hypothetical protein